jgi:hypothetical protein
MKILLFRILGNDLNLIHGDNQTFLNLKFTLENEPNFPYTDKIYLLNRIYNETKRTEIINLLKEYNQKFFEIPFNYQEFNLIELSNKSIFKILPNKTRVYCKKTLRQITYPFNLYLINNNGSRNFCLNYGYENDYDWILPLDSNSFFNQEQFDSLISCFNQNIDVIFIPQIRIDNNNLKNQDVLKNHDFKNLITFEPQIAFHKNSKLFFNEKIPYGYSPKLELINAITKKEEENIDNINNRFYNIPTRNLNHLKFLYQSSVFRLSSYNPNNNPKNNFKLRSLNIYKIVKDLRNNV